MEYTPRLKVTNEELNYSMDYDSFASFIDLVRLICVNRFDDLELEGYPKTLSEITHSDRWEIALWLREQNAGVVITSKKANSDLLLGINQKEGELLVQEFRGNRELLNLLSKWPNHMWGVFNIEYV